MLKSTYTPAAAPALAPLPPDWTEHKAPTGHTYYYNALTKESTYKRPSHAPPPQPLSEIATYGQQPNLADPNVANAYLAQFQPQAQAQQSSRGGRGGHGGHGRGGHEGRPKPAPTDKPIRREDIPGHEPWVLVYTKYSRRFVFNPEKKTSYWRIPEKLMPGVLELDKARIRRKTSDDEQKPKAEMPDGEQQQGKMTAEGDKGYDSSEYEEVEVTDDEDENPSKRQRVADAEEDEPVEFTEADIAAQLQAMGAEYGLEPGEYDDGNMEEWPEGAEGVEFSEEDAKLLFKDLLDDFRINPYSPWDKLIEEGKIIDDPRYTALTTSKARRECWDEWTRERIAALQEQRAKQEKKDPRIAYMAFLQDKASPKLYWPEFKRKYKKEAPMKDYNLSDKDREKAYREHINRLKQPQATRTADLTALLKAQPVHVLNNKSNTDGLPTQILIDARYAVVEPSLRDQLVEAYTETLPPPPVDLEDSKATEEAKDKRERRQRALEERNRAVDEQRRERERDVKRAEARLREGEREVEIAMRVGRDGLRKQLEERQS